jgi:hypothetical protein
MTRNNTVCPEPVEGPSFLEAAIEEEGFDKLSPNGFSYPESSL